MAGRRRQPAGVEADAERQDQQQQAEAQQQQQQAEAQLHQQQLVAQQQQQQSAVQQQQQQVRQPVARPRPPQRAHQQREPPPAHRRPAVRAPVALASLGLEEADLFGAATAARAQPSPQQAQRVTVRRAEPVKPPSRSEMQALLQKEREAERRRKEQRLRAEAEHAWQQQRLAGAYPYPSTLPAQRAEGAAHGRHSVQARPTDSGGSCDTWRAAVRGNGLQGGEEDLGEAADEWWDEEEQEVQQQQEEEEEQGQEAGQPAGQTPQPQGQQRQRQRRRGRRGRKRRRQWQDAEEEEEGEDGACEASSPQSYEEDLDRIVRAVPHQWVNSSLEADLWKGKTPELQPLTTHVRRQLGER